jgi:hypothetical protein
MITLTDKARAKHVYIIGKTGTGKTTLLLNLIRQDIVAGKGVVFIDPHGDAAKDLLEHVPANRVNDTIYFEPTTIPIGLECFGAKDEQERQRIADDLYIVFRRMSDSWGERMDAIFRFAFATLLRIPDATLLDLYSLLSDDAYRGRLLSTLSDPLLRNYWYHQFPKYPPNAPEPILSRMSKFVLSPILRTVIGSKKGISISRIIDSKSVFIVNLGRLGEDTQAILGSVLVSQVQIAAMRRANIPKQDRVPCYLYVDEFQNFSTPAFIKILAEARKFALHLTISHQFLSQVDNKMRDAVFGTVGTIIALRVQHDDASKIARELGLSEPQQLLNLPDLYALVRHANSRAYRFRITFPPQGNKDRAAEIIKHTQTFYAVPPVESPNLDVEPPSDDVLPSPPPKRRRK